MAIARVFGAQPSVYGGDIVTIETDLSRGLYAFTIVGLAGKAVEEAKDRMSAAIKNTGFASPKSDNHKIVVSLAPADLKKEGPVFDLPMAVAFLIASGELRADLTGVLLAGELALDGTLRPIRGALPIAQAAAAHGFTEVIVPAENAAEAAFIPNLTVTPALSLLAVVRHLDTHRDDHQRIAQQPPTTIPEVWMNGDTLLEDIRGQESAKRGLMIAAAGRHNILMVGPPGTGKTMLARAFQGLLPPLTTDEALEVTAIHGIAGTKEGAVTAEPPFRAPHHTASHTSLVGGGTIPKPGEVTLAHRGVLFLDEFPEFERRSIDALRQPLEDRVVSISRVQGTVLFPADFILVAAMNPSRGGDAGNDYGAQMLETYKHKISGPILDRMDLWLPVPHVDYETLTRDRSGEEKTDETTRAREQITSARARQRTRLHGRGITTNAEMSARDIEECITLTSDVRTLLKTSSEKLKLSPRSYHRTIKVARTIADLDDKEHIEVPHLLEALQYRVSL